MKIEDATTPIKDRLVYVEWADAFGVTQEWLDVEELKKRTPCICISVGLLLVDDPEHIVVLPHFGVEPATGCGEMVIPRSQIRIFKRLRLGSSISQ